MPTLSFHKVTFTAAEVLEFLEDQKDTWAGTTLETGLNAIMDDAAVRFTALAEERSRQ